LDYFRFGHVGNYWKYYTVHDVMNPANDRWTLVEVAGDTVFGVSEETRSFKVKWGESGDGNPPFNTYNTLYYTVNTNRDLCISARWDYVGDTLAVYDPMCSYLANPIDSGAVAICGDSMETAVVTVVVSLGDTLNLPIGNFENCLTIYQLFMNNGQPAEAKFIYYAGEPVYGVVKEEGYYWYSYPDSFRFGYSYLTDYNTDPDLHLATLLQNHSTFFSTAGITLRWTLSEIDEGIDFVVSRGGEPDGPFVELPSHEVGRDGLVFTFIDRDWDSGATYYYRVDARKGTEQWELFETGPVAARELPLALHQNRPNPFNPSSAISYYLPEAASVSLDVYDLSGRRIITLTNGMEEKGPHSVTWNGRNTAGEPVESGVYFYRLRAGKETISRKMVLLR
jgi:hypothetical protein